MRLWEDALLCGCGCSQNRRELALPAHEPTPTAASAYIHTGLPARPATALNAVIKAGGDYYPGKVRFRTFIALGIIAFVNRSTGSSHERHQMTVKQQQVEYGDSTIDVVETLKQNGKFNTLVKALEATGLDKVCTNPYYVCMRPLLLELVGESTMRETTDGPLLTLTGSLLTTTGAYGGQGHLLPVRPHGRRLCQARRRESSSAFCVISLNLSCIWFDWGLVDARAIRGPWPHHHPHPRIQTETTDFGPAGRHGQAVRHP